MLREWVGFANFIHDLSFTGPFSLDMNIINISERTNTTSDLGTHVS